MILFEYIAEHASYYRRLLAISVFFLAACTSILIILIGHSNKSVSDYEKEVVVVKNIGQDFIRLKADNHSFSNKKWKQKKALVLSSDKGEFCLKSGYSHKWEEITNGLKKGNSVTVYYRWTDDQTVREFVELRKNGVKVFALSEIKAPIPNVIIVIVSIILFLIFFIFNAYRYRKRYLIGRNWP